MCDDTFVRVSAFVFEMGSSWVWC